MSLSGGPAPLIQAPTRRGQPAAGRVVVLPWSSAARRRGHRGHRVAYLGQMWQSALLLPALDPAIGAHALAADWAGLALDQR